MSDFHKLLWTLLGLVLAAVVGYGVAAFSISDLNKRVLDAAQNLGRLQEQTKRIEEENTKLLNQLSDLARKNVTLASGMNEVEANLQTVKLSESTRLLGALAALSRTPDLQAIGTKIAQLEQQVKASELRSKSSGQQGCLQLGDGSLQICWGAQELSPDSHVRKFNITFPQSFASSPLIVPGINTASDGHAPAIYQFSISPTNYQGAVNNMHVFGGFLPGKVVLSYVAIGIPN